AASSAGRSRGGFGSLTREPLRPAGSGPKPTVKSSRSAIARNVAAVARLKISVGENSWAIGGAGRALHQGRVDARFRELGAEAALVVFGDGRTLHLVAFVEERQPEAKGQVAEDARILGRRHHLPRRPHGGAVGIDEL